MQYFICYSCTWLLLLEFYWKRYKLKWIYERAFVCTWVSHVNKYGVKSPISTKVGSERPGIWKRRKIFEITVAYNRTSQRLVQSQCIMQEAFRRPVAPRAPFVGVLAQGTRGRRMPNLRTGKCYLFIYVSLYSVTLLQFTNWKFRVRFPEQAASVLT